MPQMGESVAEGTIVRWIKKVGDAVERDEPLFEISTDKVDAEIPAPAAGVLSEIKVKEGETVPVNSVVAVIGEAGAKAPSVSESRAPVTKQPNPPATPAASQTEASAAVEKSTFAPPGGTSDRPAFAPPGATVDEPTAPSSMPPGVTAGKPAAPAPAPTGATTPKPAAAAGSLTTPWSAAEARALRLSPLVRKIAKEHHVDVRNIAGSGSGGRVTKSDILSYIDAGGPAGLAPAAAAPAAAPSAPQEGVERVPMTVMRRRIAEHMVMSRRTSAHVHSVFEVDFTNVDEIRRAKKAEYEKAGSKITYMAFIAKAVAAALHAVPVVNASVDGTDVLYRKDINIGVAVALDWGLIVPVIKNADRKSLLDISKAIVDLAARARDKKLSPDDVQSGTFTITNPGVFGALFGMPIINQPQVAILGVGAVEKRPVVINDGIAIRVRAYLTLGYDHRIIDGAVADEFMSKVKHSLENWDLP